MGKNCIENLQNVHNVTNFLEEENMLNIKKCCNVYFFGKKGLLSQKEMEIEDLDDCASLLKKSKMIVINTDNKEKKHIYDMLNKLYFMYGHYGPIVQVGQSNLFFFPQLSYGDIYLVKNLVEQVFIDEEISVVFGKTIVC